MATIKIDVDKNRLTITPHGFADRNILLALPSRKWMQSMGVFVAPITRQNVEIIARNGEQLKLEGDTIQLLQTLITKRKHDRKFPTWYTFKTQPFEHQRAALNKLYCYDAAALAMDLGTGKTKTCIDIMTASFFERRIKAVVVICPLTVCSVWAKEIPVHCPAPARIKHVTSDFKLTKIAVPDYVEMTWLVVGSESLSQGKAYERIQEFIQLYQKDVAVVVDESSDIKNPDAIRTQRVIDLGHHSPLKIIMSGLPVLNSLIDLYSQYEFLDPNIIGVGNYYAFRNRYAIMGGYKNKEIIGYNHTDELMGLLEPVTYRITKAEALTLLPKLYTERVIKLAPEQTAAIANIKKGIMPEVTAKIVLTRVARLQEVVGGWLSIDDGQDRNGKNRYRVIEVVPPSKNPKLLELKRIAETDDHPTIVWAKHLHEIRAISALLEPYGGCCVLTGETPAEERGTLIDDFQMGRKRFFIATQMAGGVGITLTAAKTVVYYSNTYSLKDRMQSEDRAHRQGQKNQVIYIDLIADRTVDTIIKAALLEKKDLADYVSDRLQDKQSTADLFGD